MPLIHGPICTYYLYSALRTAGNPSEQKAFAEISQSFEPKIIHISIQEMMSPAVDGFCQLVTNARNKFSRMRLRF